MKTTSWAQPWALALCTSAITLASVVVAPAQTTLAQNNLAFASTGTDAVTIVSNRVDLSKAIASVKVEDNNNGLTLVPQLVSDPSNTGQKLLGWNFSISRVLQRSAASFGIIYTSGLVNWLDGTNGIGAFNVRPQQTYNDGIGVVLSASDSATQNISSTGTKATGQDTYFISGATVTAYGDKSTKFLRWSNDNVGKLWADAEWLNVGNDGHYTIGFDGATQLTKDANIWVAAKVPALRDNIPATNDMVDLAGPAFAAAKNAFIWTIENLTMQDANSPWAGQLYAYAQTLADNATDTQALADYAVDVENILNENKSYKLRNPQAIVAALNLFATPETVAGVSSAARTSADFLADARAQLASARKASSADDTLAYTSSIADSATTASNRIRTTSDALYAAQAWRAATAAYVIAASRYVAADADDKAQDALANVTTTAANAKQYLKRVTDSTDATADERTAAQDTLDAINRMSAMTVDSIRAYQAQQGTGAGTGSNTDTDGGADTGSTGSNTETDPNADGGTKGTGTGDNTGTAGDGQGSGAGDNSGTNTGTKTDTDPNVDTDAGVKGSGSGTGSGTDSGSGSGSGSDSGTGTGTGSGSGSGTGTGSGSGTGTGSESGASTGTGTGTGSGSGSEGEQSQEQSHDQQGQSEAEKAAREAAIRAAETLTRITNTHTQLIAAASAARTASDSASAHAALAQVQELFKALVADVEGSSDPDAYADTLVAATDSIKQAMTTAVALRTDLDDAEKKNIIDSISKTTNAAVVADINVDVLAAKVRVSSVVFALSNIDAQKQRYINALASASNVDDAVSILVTAIKSSIENNDAFTTEQKAQYTAAVESNATDIDSVLKSSPYSTDGEIRAEVQQDSNGSGSAGSNSNGDSSNSAQVGESNGDSNSQASQKKSSFGLIALILAILGIGGALAAVALNMGASR